MRLCKENTVGESYESGKSKGKSKSKGMRLRVDIGLVKMLGGFTVLRLTSMMGMINVSFTKEELLEMNRKLNKIRK